jgi:hypothetical protein
MPLPESSMKDYSEFHEPVYSQDNPKGESHGWIQWKGTDVCVDLHCKCGHHGHYDGDFFYYYKCPKCGERYAVGQNIKLIELTAEQAAYVESERGGFDSDDLEAEA